MVRRMRALLDVERASIGRYQHRWFSTFFYLARSFMRVPRASIQLRRFWVARSVVSPGDAAAAIATQRLASPARIAWRSDRAW
jgi:hypothetical protein